MSFHEHWLRIHSLLWVTSQRDGSYHEKKTVETMLVAVNRVGWHQLDCISMIQRLPHAVGN